MALHSVMIATAVTAATCSPQKYLQGLGRFLQEEHREFKNGTPRGSHGSPWTTFSRDSFFHGLLKTKERRRDPQTKNPRGVLENLDGLRKWDSLSFRDFREHWDSMHQSGSLGPSRPHEMKVSVYVF